VRRFLTFLRYELLMHIKSWRLWLCLATLLAATVPWKLLLLPQIEIRTLDQIAEHCLEIRQTDWLLFVPIVILITVDTVARVRILGVDSLLLTRPFSPLSFLSACWTAMVILSGLLAGATFFVRYLIGRFFFGLATPAAPFGWLLGLVAIPSAMAVVAVTICVRNVVKHNISAYLISAILTGAIYFETDSQGLPFLGWNQEWIRPLVQPYVPAIGRDLDWPHYGWALFHTALLSLLFLALACYFTRRQERQRPARRNERKRWTDMPTFRGLLAYLKPDRHTGLAVHSVFLATVVLVALVGFRWKKENKETLDRRQRWAAELRHNLSASRKETAGLTIRHYAGDIAIQRNRAARCELLTEVANTTDTAVSQVALTIPFNMEVARFAGERLREPRCEQFGNLLVADLHPPLPPGASTTLHLVYQGIPQALEIGEPIFFSPGPVRKALDALAGVAMKHNLWHPRPARPASLPLLSPPAPRYDIQVKHLDDVGLVLGSRYLQINAWLLPRSVSLMRRTDGVLAPMEMPRLFTADLGFSIPSDLRVISADGPIEPLGRKGELSVARLRVVWPRGDFGLLAGPYDSIERRFGPLALSFYCFPSDRELIEFGLTQMEETIERWGLVLGSPKSGSCVIVETPDGYAGDDGMMGSGVLITSCLDRLRRYRPYLKQRHPYGIAALDVFQSDLSATLAGKILRDSFHPDAHVGPLREALYFYLFGTVQRSELGPDARRSARLFQRRRVGNLSSFLDPASAARFNTPLAERMAAPSPTEGPPQATHIWQMLHFVMEDERFAAFLRALTKEYGDRIVTLADLRQLAERFYGAPLDWFFNHWFFGVGVPKYEIAEARAAMIENQQTRDMEYDVRIVIANKGRGRMPVPVVLQTERDRVTRMVWLDSAASETVLLHVPDRPETVFIDPEGWIAQEPAAERDTRSRGPAWRRVRIVE